MKKFLITIAILMLLGFAVVIASPWAALTIAAAQPLVALTYDGVAYLVENRTNGAFLYGVGSNDAITSVVAIDRIGGLRPVITGLYSDGERVYFFCELWAPGGAQYERWELTSTDGKGATTPICSGRQSELPDFRGLSMSGGRLYITAVDPDGSGVRVYEVDPEAEQPTAAYVLAHELSEGTVTDALFTGGTLYMVNQTGSISRLRMDGMTYPESYATVGALGACGASLILYESGARAIYSGPSFPLTVAAELPNAAVRAAAVVTGVDGQHMAVLCGASAGDGVRPDTEARLIRWDSGVMREIKGFTAPPLASITVNSRILFGDWYWVLIAAVALLLLLSVTMLARRLPLRVAAAMAGIAGIAVGIIAYGFYNASDTGVFGERERSAHLLTENYVQQVSAVDLIGISSAGFYATDAGQAARDALDYMRSAGLASGVAIDGDLLSLTADGAKVALSRAHPEGLSAYEALGGAIARLTLSVGDRFAHGTALSAIVTLSGERTLVNVRPITRYGDNVALLVTRVGLSDMDASLRHTLWWLTFWAMCVLLCAVIIMLLYTYRMLRPLRRLTKRMNDVSLGMFDAPEEQIKRRDEVGVMQRTMQEMCVALAIKDYETRSMIGSFARFVPRGMDRLLDRPSIMETSCGDMAAVNGRVGIIAVGNRGDARRDMDDGQYMDFVSRGFGVIYDCVGRQGGILLSSDFDMGDMRVYLPGEPESGVNLGLDLLGEERGHTDGEMQPEFSLMLHSAEFLYSVVGNEEKAFPFLSSADMEFLASLSEKLRSLGVRIAATDRFLREQKVTPVSRCIGFVTSPDKRYTYRLHDMLDAYPETERARLLANEPKFREGLRLYYKNDFYLARNIFSSLLKACPGDGAARWYIFACERYFNSDDLSNARYDLFGTDE